MTRLMEICKERRFPQPLAKPCWVSHISHRPDGGDHFTTEHFSTAAIHLRKADFLSEGWGVPQLPVVTVL